MKQHDPQTIFTIFTFHCFHKTRKHKKKESRGTLLNTSGDTKISYLQFKAKPVSVSVETCCLSLAVDSELSVSWAGRWGVVMEGGVEGHRDLVDLEICPPDKSKKTLLYIHNRQQQRAPSLQCC